MTAQVLTSDSTTGISASETELAHLTFARTPSTTEKAPPLVSSMILKLRQAVAPDYLFMGSFGVGGKQVGQLGSVTDYMIRLSPCSVVIVKHWRPVPALDTEVTYVVALDGGKPSFDGLAQILHTAKKGDRIKCVIISPVAEDEADKETKKTAHEMISSAGSLVSGEITQRLISEKSKESEYPIGTECSRPAEQRGC